MTQLNSETFKIASLVVQEIMLNTFFTPYIVGIQRNGRINLQGVSHIKACKKFKEIYGAEFSIKSIYLESDFQVEKDGETFQVNICMTD